MNRAQKRQHILKLLRDTRMETITKTQLMELCRKHGINEPQWFTKDPEYHIARGVFRIPYGTDPEGKVTLKEEVVTRVGLAPTSPFKIRNVVTDLEIQNLIPPVYKNFIPFGVFDDLKKIIDSRQFYPILITGHSGTGKSMPVEQACAQLQRKFVALSMTHETDEGDLLGNYVLIDNQMVWRDGAVTLAARHGAVLLIDEIDFGGQNLGTLQRVLEGRPFLLKKKNELVIPQEGFTIIATANTKGKGSEDGRYMYTNILNEAFLERFPITFVQEWAPTATEKVIITKEMEDAKYADAEFAKYLVEWAHVIRETFNERTIDEVISTRRLVHIARAYGIFRDREKALMHCLSRFDDETRLTFIDLYSKLDASIRPMQMKATPTKTT